MTGHNHRELELILDLLKTLFTKDLGIVKVFLMTDNLILLLCQNVLILKIVNFCILYFGSTCIVSRNLV